MKTIVVIEIDHDETADVNTFVDAVLNMVDFDEIPVHVRSVTLAPTTLT